jgi:predicted protein tyrosine phosphatase
VCVEVGHVGEYRALGEKSNHTGIGEEADIICAMEDAHQRLIRKRFGEAYAAKVIVLDIPANYICWEAGLVDLLKPKLRAALGIALHRQ